MPIIQTRSRDELLAQRREVEGRYSLRDLVDAYALRPLTPEEQAAVLELQKIAFLLGEDVPEID